MIQHAILTAQDGIHAPYSYSYADTTARLAAAGFVSADIGKLAFQTDNKSVWLLANHSPITWNPLDSSDAQSIQGRAVANTAPTNGQALIYNLANTRWEPGTNGTITSVFGRTTLAIAAESGDYSAFYALIAHNHDGAYSSVSHNHNGIYSLVAHNHTGVYATLTGGKLTIGELPAVAITDTTICANQAAMLALTAEVGDVAVRTDLSKSFILKTEPATVLGNWVELLSPTGSNYSPATPTDWANTPPTTISEALDRISSALALHFQIAIP